MRRVEEVMVQQVHCATPTLSVLELAKTFNQHHISCLVITKTGPLGAPPIGIVTERDLLRLQDCQSPLAELMLNLKIMVECLMPKAS